MLTPEEAKQRLAESKGDEARILERVAKLPKELRELAQPLLDQKEQRLRWYYQVKDEERARFAKGVEELPIEKRRKILAAFVPRLADDMLRAWKWFESAPYQWGYSRRAFRAPSEPALARSGRMHWIFGLFGCCTRYEQDLDWWAVWGEHAGGDGQALAMLLAAVIDEGGPRADTLLATLIAALEGRHEIANIGRSTIRALAGCARPAAWEALEQLLLRAQREEGLRQVILESVDLAHPGCFARMLRVIADQDLARFSSVARAVDVWFGLGWDSQDARRITSVVTRVARWSEDRTARAAAIESGIAEDVYLGLHLEAFEDAVKVLERAAPLLRHESVEVRYAAARLVSGLGHTGVTGTLYAALDDADLRVAALAVDAFARIGDSFPKHAEVFEKLEAQLERWPVKSRKAEPILWPWCVHELGRSRTGDALLTWIVDRPLERLRPHLGILDANARDRLCRWILDEDRAAGGAGREILLEFLGDASTSVREAARRAIAKSKLAAGEELRVEGLLTRKAEELRVRLIDLLLGMDDERARASAERLLAAKDERQRAGGLELLRRLGEAKRMADWCVRRAKEYAAARGSLNSTEGRQLEAIARPAEDLTLDDALGLSPQAERTALPEPRDLRAGLPTAATNALLRELDEFIAKHAARSVTVGASWNEDQKQELAFGALHEWHVYSGRRDRARPPPLQEEFEAWWRERGPALRGADGYERARAMIRAQSGGGFHSDAGVLERLKKFLGRGGDYELTYGKIARGYLSWWNDRDATAGLRDFLLDAYETALARLAPAAVVERHDFSGRADPSARWLCAVRKFVDDLGVEQLQDWSDAQLTRLWNLERALLSRSPTIEVRASVWIAAVERGVASDADLVGLLLRPSQARGSPHGYSYDSSREVLRGVGGTRLRQGLPLPPRIAAIVQRVRERLLELEFARGEAATIGSAHCAALSWTGGLDTVARASAALHGGELRRSSSAQAREESLSRILQATRPAEGETPDRFAERLPPAQTGETRLLEIALFAPQWSAHVEHTLGWPAFAEAVWWIHAHTKDDGWSVEQDLRESWAAQTSERTPLSSQDLLEGAVDVAWFERVRAGLGAERFEKLLKLAKYCSSGTGHTRAQLFANALLGRTQLAALEQRIREKRHPDSVRALGLVPLAQGAAGQAELLRRWLAIQEFVRGSRKFGSMRQASEKRAAAIGLDNLARTAGYPDPVRLEWAMEREALGDLVRGSVKAVSGELEVELRIDAEGDAQLEVRKAGKRIQKLPATAKKQPELQALAERAKEIRKQKQRMRASLETAMVRGDLIRGSELAGLMQHPVLAPLLRRLVLMGDGLCGYPLEDGRALRDHGGKEQRVAESALLRIAHPFDLFGTREWSAWQRECLRRELVQPFKQVFRELYVLTDAEREERTSSQRYAGHQVQPRQALALLGTRGWVWHAERGVRRVDHASNLAAWIGFLHAPYTPVDVEGLTLETVVFTRRGEWQALPLESIPVRLFSEVMRDLDLVVSVANRSGIDPEASASSVEARAALVRETCALLGLLNVRIDGRHAFIEGKLGNYSLHLGSAGVHKLPGGHVCIVPVHAQHRGRVFLPFADDDPKTAEILSKVLLLARDEQIKDPSILEQLRR